MSKDQRKKLSILMLNMFIAVGSFGLILPILPAYLRELGQGGTAAGMIIALFAGAQLIFSPIGGRFTDQYGRRKMIILGLFGLGFSMLLFYLAPNIWFVYVSRFIGGVGAAFCIPAIFAYVADITTMDQRAKGNSFISASMSLGIVVGPGIGGFLAEYGTKTPLLVSAIVGLAAVVISYFTLQESRPEGDVMTRPQSSLIEDVLQSPKKPYFIPLIIIMVMSFGLIAYETVLGLYVDAAFGATAQEIAWMITATGAVSVIIQLFVVDYLVRRFGEPNLLVVFLGIAALGFFLSLIASSYAMFFGITLLVFLATSLLRPVLTTMISKMAGNEQGLAMGLNNSYMSIGNILGPLLAGAIYDIDMKYPFMLGLVVLMATILLSITWRRKAKIAL